MNWINLLLDRLRPSNENPVAFTTKIERPSDMTVRREREKQNVKLFFQELVHHFNRNSLENFRNSNSLVVRSQYASGLVINRSEETSDETFMIVFDTLKRNTEALNYRLNYQNCEINIKGQTDERKEVYYLKPKFDYSQGRRYQQKYGNVKLERNMENGETVNITLLCTYYSGFNYEEPLPFDEFVDLILSASW